MTAPISMPELGGALREGSTRALFPAIPWTGRRELPAPAPARALQPDPQVPTREVFARVSWTEVARASTGPTKLQQQRSVKRQLGTFPWE